jgi:adenylate kinase
MSTIICLIGGSGSGKDTQGNILSKKLGRPHISMGGIMRAEGEAGNPLGIKALEILNKGVWVDGETVAALLEGYLARHKDTGVILNGFPRSDDQRQYFPGILQRQGLTLEAVVLIEVPREILLERMKKQIEEGQQRADTSPEAMEQRLKSYYDTVNPIIEGYKEEGVLITVDGAQSIEGVATEIETKLKAAGVNFPQQ